MVRPIARALLALLLVGSWACSPGEGRRQELVAALRAEPASLNPVVASDQNSRTVLSLLHGELIQIDGASLSTVPALAESWSVSEDGRVYILRLRQGVRFSDGEPFDADDVVFSFALYLDEELSSPQRPLLMVGGEPVRVTKVDSHTVAFELALPYAAGDRLFDGFLILPEHKLRDAWESGELAEAWGPVTDPSQMAGLGPFRLREYRGGESLVLEANPFYWRRGDDGGDLPRLQQITFLFVGSSDAEVIRFQSGEIDVISRLSAENFNVLEQQEGERLQLVDLGPGLEYAFLFFNLNDLEEGEHREVAARQHWFRDPVFRRAISRAIDREALVQLVFQGRATPLWGHVPPGSRPWFNEALPRPARSLEAARRLLADAGYRWSGEGKLLGPGGGEVEFSIVTNADNDQRMQMATMLQHDLGELGMTVRVVGLEFRALLERLLSTHEYDACVLSLGGGDADPNPSMNVLMSDQPTHLWRLQRRGELPPWQIEIDELMRRQLVELDRGERKRLYDRVQVLMSENLPLIGLASPSLLVGSQSGLEAFRPSILEPHALWNADELHWR